MFNNSILVLLTLNLMITLFCLVIKFLYCWRFYLLYSVSKMRMNSMLRIYGLVIMAFGIIKYLLWFSNYLKNVFFLRDRKKDVVTFCALWRQHEIFVRSFVFDLQLDFCKIKKLFCLHFIAAFFIKKSFIQYMNISDALWQKNIFHNLFRK